MPRNTLLSHFAAICLLAFCIPVLAHAQQFVKKGDFVTYRGNKFEYSKKGKKETITVIDPTTHKKVKRVTTVDPTLIKMNGKKIYNMNELTVTPAPNQEPLQTFVIRSVLNDLSPLPDGIYYIDLFDVVIDDRGKIVYYQYGGILPQHVKTKIPDSVKAPVDAKMDALVNKAPSYSPGMVNDKRVIVRTDIFYDTYKIIIKNHKAALNRD